MSKNYNPCFLTEHSVVHRYMPHHQADANLKRGSLPASALRQAGPASTMHQPILSRKADHMRILLIEDDTVLGAAVRDQIAGDGHSVDWVGRLDAAGDAMRAGCVPKPHLTPEAELAE